ncbi:membrane dipeptidase [Stella humosa]|uniref:Membrane dipeptidase n=1 Tax=Stella humosa TaxID=94 RepID=A0A3N1MLD7_9PROT|nr:dipeptidase [Stella humosa]ROQ01806.1 membrane dipeptidase [Stella humosa]
MATDPVELYRSAIVIDATCPLLDRKGFLDSYRRGGVTALCPTVGATGGAAETFRALTGWLAHVREQDDLLLVRRAADIDEAKRSGRIGIIVHFQGADPVEDDLALLDGYHAMGLRMLQLAYNVKNRVGDGCEERTDAGLSRFGIALIERLEALRIVLDCSHTGYRTTMEAMERATRPVVFSHSNPRTVKESPRNIGDDQIRAVAATGGLIGMNGFPAFVAARQRPTVDDLIDHIDYTVQLVGDEHVGLGIDYYQGQHPFVDEAEARRLYDGWVAAGHWNPANYPPPPYHYPQGIETPDKLPHLAERLSARGYGDDSILKILGRNWQRVFREVWGA